MDSEIGVIKVVGEEKEPIALLVNFAVHPTILRATNMFISGDLSGYLARYLEENVGECYLPTGLRRISSH